MGNSEVGHLNIGAGRVVYQDYTRIDLAIANGEFARNPALADAVAAATANGSTLHVLGLRLPGRRPQPRAADRGDGRDGGERRRAAGPRPRISRRPRHAAEERGRVARLHRRRVRPASPARGSRRSSAATTRWTATSAGIACTPPTTSSSTVARRYAAASAAAALAAAYARGETDEFVKATAIRRRRRRTAARWATATSSCS